MSNPTRAEIVELKVAARPGGRIQELCDFALRALDMRDEIVETHGLARSKDCCTCKALAKFDGGDDE